MYRLFSINLELASRCTAAKEYGARNHGLMAFLQHEEGRFSAFIHDYSFHHEQ